jgi:hypothetical protein
MSLIEISLLVTRNKYLRLDVIPFIIIYSMLITLIFSLDEDNEVYIKLAFIGAIFLNCIVYLSSHWSARMKAIVQYSTIS